MQILRGWFWPSKWVLWTGSTSWTRGWLWLQYSDLGWGKFFWSIVKWTNKIWGKEVEVWWYGVNYGEGDWSVHIHWQQLYDYMYLGMLEEHGNDSGSQWRWWISKIISTGRCSSPLLFKSLWVATCTVPRPLGRRREPMEWPPRSPDLTPVDFFFGDIKFSCIQRKNQEIFKTYTINTWIHVMSGIFQDVWQNRLERIDLCVRFNGHHFEDFL